MNVSQLIEELQRYAPHLPVRGFMTCIYVGDELSEIEITPTHEEAQEVTNVVWRGKDVCLECDGMVAE